MISIEDRKKLQQLYKERNSMRGPYFGFNLQDISVIMDHRFIADTKKEQKAYNKILKKIYLIRYKYNNKRDTSPNGILKMLYKTLQSQEQHIKEQDQSNLFHVAPNLRSYLKDQIQVTKDIIYCIRKLKQQAT